MLRRNVATLSPEYSRDPGLRHRRQPPARPIDTAITLIATRDRRRAIHPPRRNFIASQRIFIGPIKAPARTVRALSRIFALKTTTA